MYWDVVEVTPEPNYCLLVRFKDGLTGRVRFETEELTGVLAPMRDVQFFDRVYIDFGAIIARELDAQEQGSLIEARSGR